MKKTLYILIAVFSFNFAKGNSTDSIPNCSFEYWINATWFQWPSGWATNNTQLLPPTVMIDTEAHSGFLAMKLINSGALQPHAWCDFPLTSHPLNMGGYIANRMNPNDSLIVVVHIFYNQQIVDSGYGVLYGSILPGYTTFMIPISQNISNADSCEISFQGGMVFSANVLIDDIQFDFLQGIPEINKNQFEIFPNPFSNQIILKSYESNFVPDAIEACNLLGQRRKISWVVDKDIVYGYIVIVNTAELQSGAWFIIIKDNNQLQSKLMIKI